MLRWMFLDPFPRDLYADREVEARGMLARSGPPAPPEVAKPHSDELLDQLLAGSPEAASWWHEPDVARIGSGHKQLQLPGIGVVDVEHAVLHVGGNPEQHLVTFAEGTDYDSELLARALAR